MFELTYEELTVKQWWILEFVRRSGGEVGIYDLGAYDTFEVAHAIATKHLKMEGDRIYITKHGEHEFDLYKDDYCPEYKEAKIGEPE